MSNPASQRPIIGAAARIRAVCVALFCGTLLLFSRSLGNGFVNYDDPEYVTANETVQAGLSWSGVRWAFASGHASNWHPITWISHELDWTLFGNCPAGHHGTSVLLHAIAAVLAFVAFRRLTGAFWTSAFGAALFAWHPLRVESVSWIAERKDVLSVVGALFALWAYAVYAQRRRAGEPAAGRFYAFALAGFAAALLCKPMVVTLPFLLLVLDGWPLRRLEPAHSPSGVAVIPAAGLGGLLLEKLPFLLLSAVSCYITYNVQSAGGSVSVALPLSARLANAAVAVACYLAKFFWPFDLAVLYPHPGHWPTVAVLGAGALLLLGGCVGVMQWRRRPWLLIGGLWFVGMLVPVIGLVQVGLQSMADRYTYLPVLGLQLALLWTVRAGVTTAAMQRGAAVVAVAVLAACAVRTWDQQGVWKSSFTLCDHAIRVGHPSALAYNNLGVFFHGEHRRSEAVDSFRSALALDPEYREARVNFASALVQLNRPHEAVGQCEAVLRRSPGFVEAHVVLGNALTDIGRVDEAVRHFEFVLARRPRHVGALNGFGVALAAQNHLPEAQAYIEASLKINPDNLDALVNLGNMHAMRQSLDDAVRVYLRALKLSPDEARVLNNLGNVLSLQGRAGEAVERYEQALRLEPVNPEAHANLGFVLAQLGRRVEAIRHLQTALAQRPDYAPARHTLDALQAVPAPAP